MAISVETRHTLNAYAQSWIKMANKNILLTNDGAID